MTESFNAALTSGDGDRACRLLKAAERERVLREGTCDEVLARQPDSGVPGGRATAIEVSGDRATARLVNDRRDVAVELERIAGTWKVTRLEEVRRGGP